MVGLTENGDKIEQERLNLSKIARQKGLVLQINCRSSGIYLSDRLNKETMVTNDTMLRTQVHNRSGYLKKVKKLLQARCVCIV